MRGKTVVTVTHTLDNIHLADKVTFLVDGKLAFFGTDSEARRFFDVENLPEVYKRFEQDLEAEYGGIGAYVGEDPNDGLFTITRPIYSGPAYHAGLTTDDKIVRIGDWPTIGQETDDIIKRLKGKPKSSVKLYIWRRGMDTELVDRDLT